MTDKLKQIVDRAGSTLTTKWRMFYRPYFNSDNECLNFIYSTIKDEQIKDESIREVEPGIYELKDGRRIYDKEFIPRRMLNTVMRMVSAARDMEQIRPGKDVFKIVFLVTCVETLQKLSGEESQKKKMLFEFFRGYTSEKDKKYIRKHFARGTQGLYEDEDAFEQFVGVLNEYRNCAAHEGEYWDYCFKNGSGRTPLSIIVKINLENYSSKNKKEHIFETTLSYKKFESIYVHTCINFIRKYTAEQHKETANADA